MQLYDDILREIGALTRTIHAIIEKKFKSLRLQKGQSIYLTRICENPGINMKELCQMLAVDKTTASKVVQKLVAESLVRKERDVTDKRAYPLYPTDKAIEAYDIIIEEENRLTRRCYNGFDENQQLQVMELVRKMRQNIENDWFELKQYKIANSND